MSRLALLVTMILTPAVLAGPVGASPLDGGPTATVAKKKCKKRKAKCKRPRRSLVRATVTWNTAADLDLWAWGPNGSAGNVEASTISHSSFSPDDTDGLGPETFTDTAYVKPGARNLSFGVCYDNTFGDNDDRSFLDTHVVLDTVTPDGAHHIAEDDFLGRGDVLFARYGFSVPFSRQWCPGGLGA